MPLAPDAHVGVKTHMKRVTYILRDGTVLLNAFNVDFVWDGKRWDIAHAWSGTLDALEQLRKENPDIEFVEQPKDST